MSKEINVVVRLMPNADDIDVSLPLAATPKDIIDTLLDAGLGIPRVDQQGNPIAYQLIPKGKNDAVKEDETLDTAQVQNGDILMMIPKVIAG